MRLASVDSTALRSAAVHISPGNSAVVVAPAARRIRAQAQWPPVTACASGVTPQQSVASTDPSALTTLDHETASLARQEREELARQDTSPREEAAQNRLAGMLRLAPGGAKMFGSTLSGWLPASEDAG